MIGAHALASRLALRRRPNGRGWAGDCPACHYRDGLRLRERDGRAVWWCANCSEQDHDRLTRAVLGREMSNGCLERHVMAEAATPSAKALRLWEAVHRTFLAPGGAGKAKLDPPRMTLGPIAGAVVRLCRWVPGDALVVGEGVETSLSAGCLIGAPAWAALSAGNLAKVLWPQGLHRLLIAADHDHAGVGQRAAWAAADAALAAGVRQVEVILPEWPGEDFNDLLQRQTAQEAHHG
jgi:phage/plasmid primase-like uncharacterized protein